MTDVAAQLLPGNSSPLERALVNAAARATEIDVPIRELWDVNTCPERLLPWLAWALAIETWSSNWPVAVKRARIRSAVDVHRRKGTAASVRLVVNSFGADLALREWFETDPPGDPYTFSVTMTLGASTPVDAAFQKSIVQALDDTKPVRAQYQLVVGQNSDTHIGVLAAAQSLTYRRLNLMD